MNPSSTVSASSENTPALMVPSPPVFLFDLCDAVFRQEGAEILGIRLHVPGQDPACFLHTILVLSHVVLLNVLPQAAGTFILIVGVQELLEETFADGLLHANRLEAQV